MQNFQNTLEYVCNSGIEYTNLPKFKQGQRVTRPAEIIQERALNLKSLLSQMKGGIDKITRKNTLSYFQERLEDLQLILSAIVVFGELWALGNHGKLGKENTSDPFRQKSVVELFQTPRETLYGEVIHAKRFHWIANVMEGPSALIEVLMTGMELMIQIFQQPQIFQQRQRVFQINKGGIYLRKKCHYRWVTWQISCQHRRSGFPSLGSVVDQETWCCEFCTLEDVHESLSDALAYWQTQAPIIERAISTYWEERENLVLAMKEAQDRLKATKRIRANGDLSQELLGVRHKDVPQWYKDDKKKAAESEIALARYERSFQVFVDYVKFGRRANITEMDIEAS